MKYNAPIKSKKFLVICIDKSTSVSIYKCLINIGNILNNKSGKLNNKKLNKKQHNLKSL